MKILADSNIMAGTVRALRAGGHQVLYGGEMASDPGDAELLRRALEEGRVFLTKDHDIGALVFGEGAPHAGVLLIDDLGDAAAERELVVRIFQEAAHSLIFREFVRAGAWGVRRRAD